jgi:biopolymer transport protein TolQ
VQRKGLAGVIDSGDFLTLMWRNIGPLVECSLILLAVMFLWMVTNIVERIVRYAAATRESRKFQKEGAELLSRGKWEDVLKIAKAHERSHVAAVFLGGLSEFRTTYELASAEESMETASRGARIGSNRIYEELRRGLSGTNSIAMTAPLVGLIGTTFGVFGAFGGYVGSSTGHLAMIATRLAEALVPTAVGLGVGVLAVWCFNWSSERLVEFGVEMETATLEMAKCLDQGRRKEKI